MINFFEIIEHLLPHSTAWKLTINKRLKEFINGLSGLPLDIKNYIDLIYLDIFPNTTRHIDLWENQFGLFSNKNLTEQQRRDRLDVYWKDLRGQSPKYIQERLRSAGFDVYIHEWWTPESKPKVNKKTCAIPRDPFDYLSVDGTVIYTIQCGEPLAQCGEPLAQSGQLNGNLGYALVNKVFVSNLTRNQCGESFMQCGEFEAQCADLGYYQSYKKYTMPNDITKFPYFLYIGAETFGDFAIIEESRREEFERLCLKICPAHQWLGMIVKYI